MAGLLYKRRIGKIGGCIVGMLVGAALLLLVTGTVLLLVTDGDVFALIFGVMGLAPVVLPVGASIGGQIGLRVADSLLAPVTSEAERLQKRRTLYRLCLGVPAAFAGVYWAGYQTLGPVSDAAMLRHFDRHAQEFDALVAMCRQDPKLQRVDSNWTSPDDPRSIGVSSERLATYRRLLREAGTPRGFQVSRDQPGIDFLFWLEGSAISDDHTKGFAYRESPPPGIVSTLDDIRGASREYWISYRHIRANWYLFYEFIPG